MKVCIITPFELPVPAVKGGAVEGLTERIVENNEKERKLDLEVLSVWDKEAQMVSEKIYNNTNFIYLKRKKAINIIDSFYEKIHEMFNGKKNSYPRRYCWKLYVLSRIKNILKKKNYDKVVFENAGYLLNVLKDKRIMKKYENNIFYHVHNEIPKNINRNGLKKCKILFVSQYLEKEATKEFSGLEQKNMYILKNGINTNHFRKELNERERIRTELGVDKSDILITFVGRITEEKGIEELIDVINEMKNDKIKLLIVGSHNFGNEDDSDFSKKIKDKMDKMREKIIFTGFVTNDNVWKYYKLGDITALPSKWEEPAGLTIIEAAMCLTPIITTNSGGITEYIDSRYSMVIPKKELKDNLKKAIKEMIENLDKYQMLAKLQMDKVQKNFDSKSYFNNFLEILNK